MTLKLRKPISAANVRKVRRTLQLSKQAPDDQPYKVGCLIFKKNVQIGEGVNAMAKTHPRASEVYEYPFPHAELMATHKVDDKAKLQGSVAYVARYRKDDGQPGMAKPCLKCMEHLRSVGVKRVYFTTEHGVDFINL